MGLNNRIRKRVLAFALLFAIMMSVFTPLGVTSAAGKKDTLYVFDLQTFFKTLPNTKVQYDYLKLATALQGLVNRETASIYFIIGDQQDAQVDGMRADEYWLQKLSQDDEFLSDKNYEQIRLEPTQEAFFQMLCDFDEFYDGIVLWDEEVIATSNIASTISGVENLLPVRFDTEEVSLYHSLFESPNALFEERDIKRNLIGKFTGEGFLPDENLNPVSADGIASSGSAKNDAYLWAMEYYLKTGKTSNEYMYYALDAFSWGASTRSRNSAKLVSANFPEKINPGQKRDVSITLQNVGKASWSKDRNYNFGAIGTTTGHNSIEINNGENGGYYADTSGSTENQRLYIKPGREVQPGEEYTFKFTLIAPEEEGNYQFSFQMVEEQVAWFGEIFERTIEVTSEELPPDFEMSEGDSSIVSYISSPQYMEKDQVATAEICVYNNGSTVWTSTDGYKLKNMAESHIEFVSGNVFGDDEKITPGQFKIFTIQFKANVGGTVEFLAQLAKNEKGFGQLCEKTMGVFDESENVAVTSEEGDNAYIYALESPVYGLSNGTVQYVDVAVVNTGSTTWTKAEGYKLGMQLPSDKNSTVWWPGDPDGEVQRDLLEEDEEIKPGEVKIFTVPITNQNPGGMFLAAQMMHGDDFFGNIGESQSIYYVTDALYAYQVSAEYPKTNSYTPEGEVNEYSKVTVKFMNVGTETWTKDNFVIEKHGSFDQTYWKDGINEANMLEESVDPGEIATFEVFVDSGFASDEIIFAPVMKKKDAGAYFGTTIQSKMNFQENAEDETLVRDEMPLNQKVFVNEKEIEYEPIEKDASLGEFYYPKLMESCLNGADFLIAKKAFFFDLSMDKNSVPNDDPEQELGTDFETLCKILKAQSELAGDTIFSVVGFPAWNVKYTRTVDSDATLDAVPAEWKFVEIVSKYGGEIDPFGGSNNTVFEKVPQNDYIQKNDKGESNEITYEADPNVEYIMLYMGDYDTSGWISGALPIYWDNERRGEYPIAWGVATKAVEKVPQAFNYLYETMTPNDYFVTADNGTGYLTPSMLEAESREEIGLKEFLDVWEKHNEKYNEKLDIDITGFLIGGNTPIISKNVQETYASITPNGVIYNGAIEQNFVNDTPFIRMTDWGAMLRDPVSAAGTLDAIIKESKQFNALRTVLSSPSVLFEAIDIVKQNNPEKEIHIVDPYTFCRLYQEAGGEMKPKAPITYDASYAETSITVDGIVDANEWKNANEITVNTANEDIRKYGKIFSAMGGPEDMDVLYKMKWDNDYLYIAETRTDNALNVSETGPNATYTVDATQICLDLQHTKNGESYDGGTYSVYFTPEADSGKCRVFLRGNNQTIALDTAISAAVLSESGYTVELAIPWTALQNVPFTPVNETLVGMSVIAIDNDGGATFKGQIQWCGNADNRATWGDMKFVGKSTAEEVNKIELDQLIKESEALVKEEYTEESWKVFEAALKAAIEVSGKGDASQAEVESAKEALKAAKEGLEKKKDDNMNNNKPTDKPDSSSQNAGKGIPDTGDDTGILPVLAVCFVSALTVAGVTVRKRNRY